MPNHHIEQAVNLNKLLSVMGGKFKFSAQGRELAPFFGNGTKVKIPSEIKPHLGKICLFKEIQFYQYILP